MIRLAPLLLLVLLAPATAWADGEAAGDDRDPWLVADELLHRGEADAALALAESASGKDTEALPAYVKRRRGVGTEDDLRELLRRGNAALSSGDATAALEATASSSSAPDTVTGVRLRHGRGLALRMADRLDESLAALEEAAVAAGRLGWLRRKSKILHASGRILFDRPGSKAALAHWRMCLALDETRGDRRAVATDLAYISNLHVRRADYPRALSHRERALAIHRELGSRAGEAQQLLAIGFTHIYLGAAAKSLSYYERALAIAEELDDRRTMAHAIKRIGDMYYLLGETPKALSFYTRELKLREELEDGLGVAHCLVGLGRIHYELGDRAKARANYERSYQIAEELNELGQMASALTAIGQLHAADEEWALTLGYLQRVVALYEKAGDRYWMAMKLQDVAELHWDLGDFEKALAVAQRSLAVMRELGARFGEMCALSFLGRLHGWHGDRDEAVRYFERAIRLAKRIRNREGVVLNLLDMARVQLDGGQPGRALLSARQGLTGVEALLGGLAEGEGATGREKYADLFGVGALAAARLDEPASALEFLENGRAGALLETLGAGRAARFAQLPEHLTRARAAAKAEEVQARREHTRALDTNDLREIRKASRRLDEAMDRRRELAARIQREAKRIAGVFYPRAALLEEIQEWMEPKTALVLLGFCLEEVLALVVGPAEARIVTLGKAEAVEAACRELDCTTPDTKPGTALAAVRSLLVEPLRLGEDVETVLVSPAGPLGYLPWGALFDRPVACVPSGTTWVLLREEEALPGAKILALGDPVYGTRPDDRAVALYRGGRLLPLPASREEAMAIGDRVLLGEEATETGLAEALRTESRWRAVHLACHGLVDAERPWLSSLALTPGARDDGFLSCLDVLGLEIPADLVVLSACETAKGQVAKAEGIVGLTRAFMYAGSPRVLCSLWLVDDEATRALMVKFYELWNPKEEGAERLGAAAALRKAQEYVRSHAKWSHPSFWSAWVLWGLPD